MSPAMAWKIPISSIITEAKYVQPTAQLLGALPDLLVLETPTSAISEPLISRFRTARKGNHDRDRRPSHKVSETLGCSRAPVRPAWVCRPDNHAWSMTPGLQKARTHDR
jgi:hypothetical protein